MLKFQSKDLAYNSKQQLTCTLVWLGNDDGARYPVYLPKEDIEKPNAELYEIAMEIIYQENFPQRAENEKFNEIGEKIAKYDELIEKSKKAIEDLGQATRETKQGTIKNEQAVNNAVSELTELVMGVLANFAPVDNVEEVAYEESTE